MNLNLNFFFNRVISDFIWNFFFFTSKIVFSDNDKKVTSELITIEIIDEYNISGI